MFLDLIGGARYQSSQVKSQFQQTSSTANYIIPYVGARLQDYQPTYDYVAGLTAEGGVTSTNRTGFCAEWDEPIRTPTSLFSSPMSRDRFYLEPLVDSANFDAGRSTLANELYFSFRGQWVRVIA